MQPNLEEQIICYKTANTLVAISEKDYTPGFCVTTTKGPEGRRRLSARGFLP